jgi:protein involved in polysaccharide export with SLBB domain
MRYFVFVFLAVALVLLPRTGSAQAQVQTLRPGDLMEIRIGGVPLEEVQQFSGTYTVDEDGTINIPYVNKVKAGGLPVTDAQRVIEQKLKDEKIYTNPTITIIFQNQARFVVVGGAVRQPGRVPFTSDLTLMAAISAAGGFNDFADQKRVRFVRDGKVTKLDARKLRANPANDIRLLPGDQIEVPQSLF